MNLRTSVAWELLKGRSEPVSRRIAMNAVYRKGTGLDLRVGSHGLSRGALLVAAQQVAQGEAITVEDHSGNPVHFHLAEGRIIIRTKTGDDGTENQIALVDLQLLSPDPTVRREAFLDLTAKFGATGPKPDVWLSLIEDRALTPDELDTIQGEMRSSLSQWREWIIEKIDSQQGLISDLTPNEPSYFSSLCGLPPNDMSPEDWISGSLAEHRRRLLKADLASGLAAILPGSVRHDLSPASLVADLDDEAVWAAIQILPDFIDPFSLLALLDIALPRRERHSGFNDLAEELAQRLLAEPFQRPDGMDVSRFYPALVITCLKSLRQTEGLGATPPCWQRLCAFTHAGHLLEIFGHLDFDVNAMTDDWPLGTTAFDMLGELLSLRSSPMWTINNYNSKHIRAEVLGRLAILRSQELVAGRTFPKDDLAAAAIEQAGIATVHPGPLEGHLRPPLHFPDRICPEEAEQKALKGLAAEPRSESDHILALASLVSLGAPLLEKAASVVKSMSLEGDTPADALKPLMFFALTAAKQGDSSLSNAVAKRCLQESRILTTANNGLSKCDMLFRILLAASAAQSNWSTWLAAELVSLTLSMPPGPWHGRVYSLLSHMKQLLRPDEWQFGRATAYAKLGDLSTLKNA